MQYCISGRQPITAIKQADEIKMLYQDIDRIIDYIKDFPDKTIIYEIPKDKIDVNWGLLRTYAEHATLMVALHDLRLIPKCQEYGLKYYWAYPITSYYELRGMIDLNPCYLFLGAPLSFDLEHIHNLTGIPIRLCANVAYDAYMPRKDGVCGQWIRPEDVKHYAPYVSAIEFNTDFDLQKERTLLQIYKFNQEWPDNINYLITNLNANADNRALPDEFGPLRVRCGQRCMQHGSCHYCKSAFIFANKVKQAYDESRAKIQT